MELSAKMRAELMRTRNSNNLPEYLVISQNKRVSAVTTERGEGKRTAIPVNANIISRQNTYAHLQMQSS